MRVALNTGYRVSVLAAMAIDQARLGQRTKDETERIYKEHTQASAAADR